MRMQMIYFLFFFPYFYSALSWFGPANGVVSVYLCKHRMNLARFSYCDLITFSSSNECKSNIAAS